MRLSMRTDSGSALRVQHWIHYRILHHFERQESLPTLGSPANFLGQRVHTIILA